MKRAIATICGVLGLLVAMGGSATAQDSFADLQAALKAGDAVSVEDDAGRQTRGTVTSVGTSLRISVGGVEREFQPEQTREIRRRGDSLTNGLVKGLAWGGAIGALMSLLVNQACEQEGGDCSTVAFLAFSLGTGAGIGVGLDAAVPGSTVVYRRQRQTVSVAPLIGPHARGIRIGVAF